MLTSDLIEIVIGAFVMGGIFGAVVALHLSALGRGTSKEESKS